MTTATSEKLWEVVQACVSSGVSVQEFLHEAKANWNAAQRDQQQSDTAEWVAVIKRGVE